MITKEPFKPQSLPLRKLKRSIFARALAQAHTEMARYAKLLKRIPDPKHLLFSLFAAESIAALESQHVHCSLEELCLLSVTRTHARKETLQLLYYLNAWKSAYTAIYTKPISKKMLCAIHRHVKKGAKRTQAIGHYRTKQNWLGLEGCKKEEAHFFPPSPKTMRASMRNLIAYCNHKTNAPTRDPLLQTSIAIAQLLILHPFMDGNGRVARLLTALMLFKQGALPYPMLFMSRYLKEHRKSYFQKLFDITGESKWEEWILFFLKGIIYQSKKGYALTRKIYLLHERLKKRLALHDKSTAFLSYLFAHPIFLPAHFHKRYSKKMLQELQALRIVNPFKKRYCAFSGLVRLLDRFRN
jgi:Fic family protein